MNVVLAKADTGRAMSDVFALAWDRLPGVGRVAEVRRQAFGSYERAGLPHRRIEEWKYTELRALMREVLPLADAPDVDAIARAGAAMAPIAIKKAAQLVLVDGVFVPGLSDVRALVAGLSVRTLREVLENAGNEARADLLLTKASDPMLSLNAAM